MRIDSHRIGRVRRGGGGDTLKDMNGNRCNYFKPGSNLPHLKTDTLKPKMRFV